MTGTFHQGFPVQRFRTGRCLKAMARCIRYCTHVLHRVHRSRPCVRPHGDPSPSPNRELLALGAANFAGSFFQCFPAGGGTSQTAVNFRAGARTQVSELVTVAIAVATLSFSRPSSACCRRPPWLPSWSSPRCRCSALRVFAPSSRQAYGVSLGLGGLRRRRTARNPPGHLGCRRNLPAHTLLSSQPSSGLRRKTQAGHSRVPSPVGGSSGDESIPAC